MRFLGKVLDGWFNNGHIVSFWHDLWVGDSPLRTLVHGPLSI
jgi:hypothetical protein